ncbi:MAG: DUF447 family protein [Gammaproteobacteria bacterium]|nr:DUF447 family protein [Gammaproteobacteria bacterium]
MIREAVITTIAANGAAHITPLGYRLNGEYVVLAPFVPSQTLENLRERRVAVLNFTDEVRIIAGALTGRRAWPTTPATQVDCPRLADPLAHWELEVESVRELLERPEFLCRIVARANHRPFLGFNRAQAAVVELAILVSRLDWLEVEKVQGEIRYLQIAIDKTAGPEEREAWNWLVAAIIAHPRHASSNLSAL